MSVLDGTPRPKSVVSSQHEAIARTPRQKPPVSPQNGPHAHQPSATQSGQILSEFEDQTLVQEGMLQRKEAGFLSTDVGNGFNVGHLSEQHGLSSGNGPPFSLNSQTRAHSLAGTGNTIYEQLSSHMPNKSIANQTRRASIYSKDNDRIGKLPGANMPSPEATYPTTPHLGNGQRMYEISRPMLTNKSSGRKRDSGTVSPCVRLQSKTQISPRFSPEGDNLNDSADGCGSTTRPREAVSSSGQANNPSSELLQGIEAYMEKEKQKLFGQIQEKDAKINEVSKENEDYKETISELRRTNTSLSEKFIAMRERANALNESVNSQLEEHKSLGDFVTKHKSQAAEYRHEAENMRTSLMEVKSELQSLQLYQRNSKVGLEDARGLAISRKSALWCSIILLILATEIESFKSLKEGLEMYKTKLQEEMEKSQLLQKELKAQHQERGLKDTIRDLLDSHCLSVNDRLAIQESKLSEAISNSDRENQSRLSDCLRLLESTAGNTPQAPKEVLEMTGLIETLSTNIGDRLQSADNGSETLRNAGTEVMEALKTRVENLFEIQDSRKELDERISSLKVDNARLEVATRGHQERILELQTQLTAKGIELDRCRAESNVNSEWNRTQLDDRQKELDKYREDLKAKESELVKAQAKIESGSVAQNELTILEESHAKSASDLADVTKQLSDCQAALAEQGEAANAMQAKNADLEGRLSSAEQRADNIERELSQFKARASESLKRQRVEAETDRRKSLESEKRSHVQKTSNLQRLRVEAETTVERLKEESRKINEDAEKKERLIRALEAEKATLEAENKAQDESLAQFEQWSIPQAAEYHSLKEDLKSTAFNIAQLETRLEQNQKNADADSQIVNKINECVEGLVSEHIALKSRLKSYERIEAKVQDYCRKSGIPFEVNAIDSILETFAVFEGRTSAVARVASRKNGVNNKTAESHSSNGQATSFTPKVARLLVPSSPEILDSQMPCAPSSSPLPRQGIRSNASQLSHVLTNTTLPARGSFEDISGKLVTEVDRYRESRTTRDSKGAHRDSLLQGPEIEDSQDKGGKFNRSPSYSPLSEPKSDEFDQPDDYYMPTSDRPENKKGHIEETARGQRPTAAPKKADVKPPKEQTHKPPSKMQANKPLKSCLKQTTPGNNSVDDKSMLSNDTVKTPLSGPTSMKQSTGRHVRKARLASISKVEDPTKKLPSDSNLIHGGSNPRTDSKKPISSVKTESFVSEYNLRKRPMCSASSGMDSEPPTKQTRLSLPARDFQPVQPFLPEASKRRESAGPSLSSQK
jgi:hypothetical protein